MSVILCETEILHLFIGGDCTCLGCDPEWTCYCTASLLPHTISEWTRLEHTHTHTHTHRVGQSWTLQCFLYCANFTFYSQSYP